MKADELRQFDDQRLDEELTKLHAEWRDLRFEEAVGKLTKTGRIRQIRKDIARIHMIRTERKIEAAVAAGQPLRRRRRSR